MTDPSNVLGVFGLSHYTRQRDLEEIFSKYGPIKEAMIVMDRRVRLASILSSDLAVEQPIPRLWLYLL